MPFGKYNKLIYALLGAIAVAIPAYQVAQEGGVSLGEWLTIAGLFVPALAAGLAPANVLPTKELVAQAIKDPNINVETKITPTNRTDLPM
jgi:hypothetical protein